MFKVSVEIWDLSITSCLVILQLGCYKKLSHAEKIRKNIVDNNPDYRVLLKIEEIDET